MVVVWGVVWGRRDVRVRVVRVGHVRNRKFLTVLQNTYQLHLARHPRTRRRRSRVAIRLGHFSTTSMVRAPVCSTASFLTPTTSISASTQSHRSNSLWYTSFPMSGFLNLKLSIAIGIWIGCILYTNVSTPWPTWQGKHVDWDPFGSRLSGPWNVLLAILGPFSSNFQTCSGILQHKQDGLFIPMLLLLCGRNLINQRMTPGFEILRERLSITRAKGY